MRSGIALFKGKGKAVHNVWQGILSGMSERHDFFYAEISSGDGAGFIETEDIDPCQCLNGFHLLHQCFFACQPADAEDKGDAGQ